MKHTIIRSILTPALAVALPCLAFGQAGSSTPSSKSQDRTTTSSSQDRSAHDRSAASGYSSTGAGGSMQRITNDQLDKHLTAKSLIGTDVHGSDGNKVGSVVDVVLGPSHSMSGTDHRMGAGSTGYTGATGAASSGSRSATAQGSTSSRTDSRADVAGNRQSGIGAADDRSSRGATAMGGMHNNMQPAVIVSTGGLMGIGNDLIRVPMSKISYDADKKEIRLNVTEDEWKTLRETRATGVTSSTR